jgi:hypothetical protein
MSLRDRLRRLFGAEAGVEPRDPPGVVSSPAGPLVADPSSSLVAGDEDQAEDEGEPSR